MKYCNYCGHPNQDGSLFCGSCGKPLSADMGRNTNATSSQQNQIKSKAKSSWVDSLNEYVGNDRPADLNWMVLFSDVFKSHTTEITYYRRSRGNFYLWHKDDHSCPIRGFKGLASPLVI